MRFKISEIGDDGLAVELPVTAAWLKAQCPDLDARPGLGGLALKGRLTRNGDDVFLSGRLRGVLETPCARCLEAARVPLDITLAVTFVEREPDEPARRHGKRGAGATAAADDDETDDGVDDEGIVHFDGDEIDLAGELRDEILLAFPPSPHCREECAGLCSVCGGNRNQVPCDCEGRQRASLSPLAELGKVKI